jgi:hypothetical protein
MDNDKVRESVINLSNNIQRKEIEDRFLADERAREREKNRPNIQRQNIKSFGNALGNASRGVNDLLSNPKKGKSKKSYSDMNVIGNVPRF